MKRTRSDLESLSVEANRLHVIAMANAMTAIEAAVACGEVLIQAKAKAGHGNFTKWLEDSFEGSTRTARCYMQVAKGLPLKRQRAANLTSLRGALEIAAESRDRDTEPADPFDATLDDLTIRVRRSIDGICEKWPEQNLPLLVAILRETANEIENAKVGAAA